MHYEFITNVTKEQYDELRREARKSNLDFDGGMTTEKNVYEFIAAADTIEDIWNGITMFNKWYISNRTKRVA